MSGSENSPSKSAIKRSFDGDSVDENPNKRRRICKSTGECKYECKDESDSLNGNNSSIPSDKREIDDFSDVSMENEARNVLQDCQFDIISHKLCQNSYLFEIEIKGHNMYKEKIRVWKSHSDLKHTITYQSYCLSNNINCTNEKKDNHVC